MNLKVIVSIISMVILRNTKIIAQSDKFIKSTESNEISTLDKLIKYFLFNIRFDKLTNLEDSSYYYFETNNEIDNFDRYDSKTSSDYISEKFHSISEATFVQDKISKYARTINYRSFVSKTKQIFNINIELHYVFNCKEGNICEHYLGILCFESNRYCNLFKSYYQNNQIMKFFKEINITFKDSILKKFVDVIENNKGEWYKLLFN